MFDGVFVPAEKITVTRRYGVLAGPLLAAAVHFAPVVAAVYLGIARGACAEATHLAKPDATRQVGEMHARLRVARWALYAAVAELADLSADQDTLVAVMTAKRHAVVEARAIVDIALEVAHGPAFFRGSTLERAYRDVRGGPFHPIPPEATLELVGRLALAARDTT